MTGSTICLHGKVSSIKLRRSPSNYSQLSSNLQNKIRLLDMLLIFTAVLFLMSMPTHEASRFFQREDQNMMNKNHLLESPLKAGQIPPSSISQKTFAGHNVSPLRLQVPPSAPNPGTYIPGPRTSQRPFMTHNNVPLLGLQQKSLLPPPVHNWGTAIP